MKYTWPVLFPTILLGLAGAGVSYNLLLKHEVKTSGLAWFDATCEAGEDSESSRSCDVVVTSKWGMFPPLPEEAAEEPPAGGGETDSPAEASDPSEGEAAGASAEQEQAAPEDPENEEEEAAGGSAEEAAAEEDAPRKVRLPGDLPAPVSVLGLFAMRPRPVALYGMLYFSALTAWYVAVGRPSYRRRFLQLLPLGVNVLGVIGAIFFAFIMFFSELEAWCPWCMVTHVINALMLVGAFLLWPRRPQTPAAKTGDAGPSRPPEHEAAAEPSEGPAQARPTDPPSPDRPAPPRPTLRTLLLGCGLMAAVLLAEWHFYHYAYEARGRNTLKADFLRCAAEVRKVQGHAKTLYSMYRQAEKKDIPLRDDDPVRNEGPNRLAVVVYSDFRCPHCSTFADYMNETLGPMFGKSMKVTFKHFPADRTCNQRVSRTLHPAACIASKAAEAARLLGGNDAFWEAHDLLFASQSKLSKPEFYLEMADELGLDRREFIETMKSEEVDERIQGDIQTATQIGLRATPSVYISGRLVPTLARQQDVFWQEVKRIYGRLLRARLRQQARARQQQEARQQAREGQSGGAESSPRP